MPPYYQWLLVGLLQISNLFQLRGTIGELHHELQITAHSTQLRNPQNGRKEGQAWPKALYTFSNQDALIPYICVSVRYLFFSFWLTSFCMTDSNSFLLTSNNSISFLFFFFRFHIYVLAYGICFSLPYIIFTGTICGVPLLAGKHESLIFLECCETV